MGPVIQANRRLRFEDDLRSEGLLYYVSALSLLTVGSRWGNLGMTRFRRKSGDLSSKHSWQAAMRLAGEHSVGFQIKVLSW